MKTILSFDSRLSHNLIVLGIFKKKQNEIITATNKKSSFRKQKLNATDLE